MEKHLDFDVRINRKGTDSIKYDFAKEMNKEEDLLPLWVADMDFKVFSLLWIDFRALGIKEKEFNKLY